MDLSKLSDEQLIVAAKIRKYAIEAGIDPDYALSHALAENSKLDNKIIGPKIEGKSERAVGVMQLLPSTAASRKVDPHNEDQNIKGGIDYLKENLQTFNNDKFLASAAYHAGPGTMKKFTETGDTNLLGPKTLAYLNTMREMTDMESPGLVEKQEEAPAEAEYDVADLENIIDRNSKASDEAKTYGFSPKQDIIAGTAGAAAGTMPSIVGGTLRATGQALGEGLQQGMKLPAATASPPAAPSTSGSPAAVRNWILSQGGKDRGAQNYGQAHEFETGTRTAAKYNNPATGKTMQPTFRFAKPVSVEAPPPPPTPPSPSPLQRVGTGLKAVATSPLAQRTLGGLGVGAGLSETVERARSGDVLGTGLAGLSTLGSAASMAPGLQVPGAAVSLGSMGALGMADAVRNKFASEAKNPPAPATEQEMKQAEPPAIIYPQFKMHKKSPDEITGALEQSLDQQMQDFSAQPAQI